MCNSLSRTSAAFSRLTRQGVVAVDLAIPMGLERERIKLGVARVKYRE